MSFKVNSETITYSRRLTPHEIAVCKDEITRDEIALDILDEQWKAEKYAFQTKKKTLLTQKKENIQMVRRGFVEVSEDCTYSVNSETKMVEYVNDKGEIVSSRPATGDELNYKFDFYLEKDGTNNL